MIVIFAVWRPNLIKVGRQIRERLVVSRGRSNRPPLVLVPTSGPGSASRPGRGLDWSKLMMRAQDGDQRAYRDLLEDVTPYLRSIAGRCFKQKSDIEDAVQDILLTIHMIRHAYDPTRPFGPWLQAIANRRIIDRLRREMRQKARAVDILNNYENYFTSPAIQNKPEFDEGNLNEAIEQLSPEQRQAIKLLKLKEMSLKEAAAVTGQSISALKVATHRAIKNLRKSLQQRNEHRDNDA